MGRVKGMEEKKEVQQNSSSWHNDRGQAMATASYLHFEDKREVEQQCFVCADPLQMGTNSLYPVEDDSLCSHWRRDETDFTDEIQSGCRSGGA